MKCRAKKVMLEAWEDRLTREYGAKAIGAIQHEAARLILGGFPWFTVAPERLNGFFRDQGEICESELNGNLSETLYVKDRRGRHKGDSFDLFHEAAEDTIFRLGRKIGEHGIDADELFERVIPEEQRKVFLGNEIVYKEGREAWAKLLGRRAFCIWIASSGLALLDMRYPSGKRRFAVSAVKERFLDRLADFSGRYLHEFIAGHDRQLAGEVAEIGRRLRERYGVELASVSTDDPTQAAKSRFVHYGTSAAAYMTPSDNPKRELDAALKKLIDKAQELGLPATKTGK
ncbi:MAG: hypothetical protein J6V24_03830 [Clostridia bacterium]|nr:hypothetical protein [Clostridia bacterium]